MYPLGSWYRGLRPVYRVPYANKFPAFGRVYRVLVPYAKKNSGLRPECVPTPAFGRAYAKKKSGLRPECVPTPAFGRACTVYPLGNRGIRGNREKKQYQPPPPSLTALNMVTFHEPV